MKKILNRNLNNLAKNKGYWYIFTLFALSIFFKNLLFDFFAFNGIELTSPLRICQFFLGKIMPSIFLGSFVFIARRHNWTILICILIDIWSIANLVYFNANDLFIDINSMLMIDNMNGFWSSLLLYMKKGYLLFPLLTVVYILLLVKVQIKEPRKWKFAGVLWLFTLIYIPASHYVMWKSGLETRKIENKYTGLSYHLYNLRPLFEPFYHVTFAANVQYFFNSNYNWAPSYIHKNSISKYLIASFWFHKAYQHCSTGVLIDNQITSEDKENINQFIKKTDREPLPSSNLIIILVESFESWVLQADQTCKQEIMPNLKRWMSDYPNLLCYNVTSQVKHGVSGDGQMIINTGLLPISSGAACRLYGNNTYPNLAHLYLSSLTINPAKGVWNQDVINSRYGIKELYESDSLKCDLDAFLELNKRIDTLTPPYYIQTITVSSHSPFTQVKNDKLDFSKELHGTLKNYLTSMNYVDSCMGLFLDAFSKDTLLQQSTVVITGDHTIFKRKMLQDFKQSIDKYHLPIENEQNYTPLIIYSPKIKEDIISKEVCYQMDIYPTILNLIGCSDYYWQGFGTNLLDSQKVNNRIIEVDKAYSLSDKIIRNDFFRSLHEDLK